MTPFDIGLIMTGVLLLLVVIGVRVAFAAAFVGIVGMIAIFSMRMGFERGVLTAAKMAGTIPHSKSVTYALSVLPTFILIGFLAYYAGLTKQLFEAAKRWLGWLPGGMAIGTVFATAGFAAVSGASTATSAVFARVAIPEMLAAGYSKRLSAAVVAAGGTLASLIPPSAILVIYAILVEESVGKLLMAGFLPGVVSVLIYAGIIYFIAKWSGGAPAIGGYSWKQRFESVPGTFPIIGVILIIFCSLYYGFATPTEAGACGAFVVLLAAFYKGMRTKQLFLALHETAKLTVMIFTLIWGVLVYVRFLGFAGLPDAFREFIVSLDFPPMMIIVCILLGYAVLGMFMDAIGMLVLTLPVVFPAIMALNGGLDVSAAESTLGMSGAACAIWFGIIVVKMAELCLITPPIGLNCFVVSGVRPDIPVQEVFRGATPFFVADVLTVAVLVAFPSIITFLPSLM
ncbi:Sialic acid TRAP transporter permease protein SiaT [Pseudovibrio axinellae]|uniref:Sialic acid TRAP transporter permease protein SiaT n=1 Tax=Pseudovibrio axinellae TaxID=989403 RepID=A0A161X8J7_9HYPH|nr:TRAP transporter large permease [Pseudovibrio axinellae]KZL05461.1 Sialic acid TRAP transporter permease protein SiaT [Pseudovibrio axinellae]SEP98286.1 TRAP transporter, DctM subunit [Pseudovibrio axinellae]